MTNAYTTPLLIIFIIMIISITPRLVQSTICNNGFTLCWQCSNMTKGGPSSATFKANLKALLHSFSTANQSDVGYYNMTKGGTEPDDKVTVIALCRGDLGVDCQTCLNDTATSILQTCPSQKEAIIWGEKCMVRYSNDSKFHHMDKEPLLVLESTKTYSGYMDSETFNGGLKFLLDKLIEYASSNTVARYASGNINITESKDICSLVQCIPSLSQKECTDCLHDASTKIQDGHEGVRVLKPSCTLRYESSGIFYTPTNQTFNQTYLLTTPPDTSKLSPPPPDTSKPSPSPPDTSKPFPVSPTTNHTSSEPSTETDGKKNSKDKIVIPHLSSVIGVVVLGMLVHGFT